MISCNQTISFMGGHIFLMERSNLETRLSKDNDPAF